MGRGISFSVAEDEFLRDNAERKTAKEIFDLHNELRHRKLWPERSIKSLARRIERLRELGKVGNRNQETRRKAYYERNQSLRGE